MLVVFLGAPGAGKGTQAARLAAKYGIPQISTGDMARDAVAADSPLGKRVKAIMDSGELVDDETMADVVRDRLGQADAASGAILDGYPRTAAQADTLQRLAGGGVDHVVYLDVPEETLIGRLTQRRACPECGANYHLEFKPPEEPGVCDRCGGTLVHREDDREEVVRERLRVYRAQTAPLVDHYESTGRLRRIDGHGGIDDIFERVDSAVRT